MENVQKPNKCDRCNNTTEYIRDEMNFFDVEGMEVDYDVALDGNYHEAVCFECLCLEYVPNQE